MLLTGVGVMLMHVGCGSVLLCLSDRLLVAGRTMQAFVKVSMDGTPYLRKVDVAAYDDYGELVEALNELFCCCSIGKPLLASCNKTVCVSVCVC